MEYVINVSSVSTKTGRNYYGFYHGKCYMHLGEYYPCHSRLVVDELVKRYTSEQRARRAGDRLLEKCGYVKGYEIYKLTDDGEQLVYSTLN